MPKGYRKDGTPLGRARKNLATEPEIEEEIIESSEVQTPEDPNFPQAPNYPDNPDYSDPTPETPPEVPNEEENSWYGGHHLDTDRTGL